MKPPLTFFIAGIPKAQPRTKARAFGKFAQVYTPKSADDWKMIVRHETQKAWTDYPNQWLGPLRVNLTFHFQRPKGHFNSKGVQKSTAPIWHTTKPDADNLFKGTVDAITNTGLWGDDKQVCITTIKKLYANDGMTGCFVEIKEAE